MSDKIAQEKSFVFNRSRWYRWSYCISLYDIQPL